MLGALGADLKSDCWMIVNEENLLSVRAMEGVGFACFVYLKQNRVTKVFRVEEWLAGGEE